MEAALGDAHGTPLPAVRVLEGRVLRAAEEGQQLVVAPAGVTSRGPLIVVVLQTPDVEQTVQR